jgi:hypothetical protein
MNVQPDREPFLVHKSKILSLELLTFDLWIKAQNLSPRTTNLLQSSLALPIYFTQYCFSILTEP